MIEIAIETCMRRGEILSLEWKHIDLREAKPCFQTQRMVDQDGWDRSRPKVIELLERLPKNMNRVFPDH